HLKAFFSTALKLNYIDKNPAVYVSPAKENSPVPKTLTEEEVSKLLKVCPDEWKSMIKAAIYTGCRLGELCRLKVSDIDLSQRKITITSTPETPTKAKQFRVIPLPKAAISFFNELANKEKDEFLLKAPKGNEWKVNWASRKFIRLAREASIDCTFHDLRRTCGAWLIMKGADLVTVQKILGHSSIDVTVKHYVHLLSDHLQSQADKMPEL
ncbi:MAG: site-specific integrase, partial [Nitrospinae bacterium]|nr:site-specific integrase [Nitrospinota bacterium]